MQSIGRSKKSKDKDAPDEQAKEEAIESKTTGEPEAAAVEENSADGKDTTVRKSKTPEIKIGSVVVLRDLGDVLRPAIVIEHRKRGDADVTALLYVINNAGHSIAQPKCKLGCAQGEFWPDEDVLRAAIELEKKVSA